MPTAPPRRCPRCRRVHPGVGRCPTCRADDDRTRGTTTQRGYGWKHQQIRDQWADVVATGTVNCTRCQQPIAAGQPWDLDHADHDRSRYLGPAHRRCNTIAGGRRAHPGRPPLPHPPST